eukprot:Hpha_TRINITY_DN15170_c3_g4::TRINITY_DN15170_c3_g4_i2::g.129050::m.129050
MGVWVGVFFILSPFLLHLSSLHLSSLLESARWPFFSLRFLRSSRLRSKTRIRSSASANVFSSSFLSRPRSVLALVRDIRQLSLCLALLFASSNCRCNVRTSSPPPPPPKLDRRPAFPISFLEISSSLSTLSALEFACRSSSLSASLSFSSLRTSSVPPPPPPPSLASMYAHVNPRVWLLSFTTGLLFLISQTTPSFHASFSVSRTRQASPIRSSPEDFPPPPLFDAALFSASSSFFSNSAIFADSPPPPPPPPPSRRSTVPQVNPRLAPSAFTTGLSPRSSITDPLRQLSLSESRIRTLSPIENPFFPPELASASSSITRLRSLISSSDSPPPPPPPLGSTKFHVKARCCPVTLTIGFWGLLASVTLPSLQVSRSVSRTRTRSPSLKPEEPPEVPFLRSSFAFLSSAWSSATCFSNAATSLPPAPPSHRFCPQPLHQAL